MAVIQGGALTAMTIQGMAQEMGSNEEQPMRKFVVWIGGTIRGAIGALLPFLSGRGRRQQRTLEDVWAAETQLPPRRGMPWWGYLGIIYFVGSLLQEVTAYRRIRAASIGPPPSIKT